MIRLVALACGLLCGVGLFVSALFQPSLLRDFLDPSERWNPTLGVGLIAALVTAAAIFVVLQWISTPVFGEKMEQTAEVPWWKLTFGAGLFGFGWGLAGYFPSAAVISLGLFAPGAGIFLASVLGGIILYDIVIGDFRLQIESLRSRG